MKKTKIILAVLLLASLFAGCNKKAEAEDNSGAETKAEKAAKNAKPNPESDFEFEACDDFTYVEVTKYKGKSKKVVIPETIQGLPVMAVAIFDGLEEATLVVFPSTVKYIYAHEIGTSLKEGKYADVVLPEGLIMIGSMRYSKISYLKFPSTLKYINDGAFSGLETKTVVLPDTLEVIGRQAFKNSTVETVTLPSPSGKLFFAFAELFSESDIFTECDHISQINVPENIAEHYRKCQALKNLYDNLNFPTFMEENGPSPIYIPNKRGPSKLRDLFSSSHIEGLSESVEFQKKLSIEFPAATMKEINEFNNNLRETLRPLPRGIAYEIFSSFFY